jgi:hypothetical protein
MSLLSVRGNERFIRNMPIVGMTPSVYGFNNLGSILNPYLNQFNQLGQLGANEIQFYSPFTGQVGPSFRPGNILNDMRRGFENNPFYNVVSTQFPNLASEPVVKTLIYNNGKINIGVIGTVEDLNTLKKILDDYYAKQGLSASTDPVASPSAPTTAPTTAVVGATAEPVLTVIPPPSSGISGRVLGGLSGLASSVKSGVSGIKSGASDLIDGFRNMEGGQ